MNRKRLAAMIMTGCLLTSVGCSTSGSGGLFSRSASSNGCCGHGGLFSRWGSSSPASAPVGGMYAGYGGADCPCSNSAGAGNIYHPAIMSQGAQVPSDFVGGPTTAMPVFPGQSAPVTTPGVPVNPMMPPANQPPRIVPVPMAPQGGIVPGGGTATATPWAPQ